MAGGQIAQVAAQATLNYMGGTIVPVVATSAPTWVPGQWWIDSNSGYAVKGWNGSSWVVDTGARYLALLTADPTAEPAVNVSDLTEVTTSGYARQQVNWTNATAAYPSSMDNSNLVTWGPFSTDMALPAQWVAMVTTISGTSGLLLYTWPIASQQVSASQDIQIATNQFSLSQS